MMRRTRQVLAVVAVTTALCADQSLAAPVRTTGPQVAELAGRLVGRLSQSFRRVVTSSIPQQARQHRPADQAAPASVRDASPATPVAVRFTFSPFQFRLPPPAIA